MARRKYDSKDYKRSKPGDPLTEEWTIRSAIISGKKRDVLIRKIDGKKKRRMIIDNRMSATISLKEAKKSHQSRKPRAKRMDLSLQHTKQKERPDKAWKKRPGRSDVKGIDSRKKKK